VHGDVDLTGVAELLDRWFNRAPNDTELDACLRRISHPTELDDFGGPFTVLVSACLLTQLIDACVDAIGAQHPRVTELVLAVRDQDLRTLVGSAQPNGTTLLVTSRRRRTSVPGDPAHRPGHHGRRSTHPPARHARPARERLPGGARGHHP
jgi:hypothetical protein